MQTLLDQVGAQNLKIAASTAVLDREGTSLEAVRKLKDRLGLWLVAGSANDVAGVFWNAHVPVHLMTSTASLARWISLAPDLPIVSDAVLTDQDDEYLEARALERLVTSAGQRSR